MSTLRVWTAFLRMKFYSIKILTVKNLTAKLYNSDSNSMAFSMALRSRSKKWLKDRPVILTSRPGLRRRRRLSADRLPVHQSTLDQEYHFEVDELTDFWRLTVHSMDEFGRKTINSTRWTEVDGQTNGWTNDPLTIFREDYSINGWGLG